MKTKTRRDELACLQPSVSVALLPDRAHGPATESLVRLPVPVVCVRGGGSPTHKGGSEAS